MKLQTVTFTQAKMLAKLGFDWDCTKYYHADIEKICEHHSTEHNYNQLAPNLYSAPTVALALKWCRAIPLNRATCAFKFRFRFGISAGGTASVQDFETGLHSSIGYNVQQDEYDEFEFELLEYLLITMYNEISE